ncbi:MAG: UDP-N-acetylmuramoyl-tripeptide--D-alanyl-D-alanine ligase [Pseudomonadota bacterium]|nr:MAG: UDP-N-acetylmuramoyl-tripeptide--D-alanyl-D-alanine ligase [Pseudomonadota bacterium]
MLTLNLLADALKAPMVGSDVTFTGVSTDSRQIELGELFVALRGPNFDGHNFLAEAITAGAKAALLSRPVDTPLPYVLVPDTRQALGSFASFWRQQFSIPVIAVTGSNGKTTVKEMLGLIMAQRGPGCVTRGNLNNEIGVPLTLLRLRKEHKFAVIEMGMNHRGEIDYLTRLTRPTVALITNAAEAHLEGLGSVEAIAQAKGEIFAGLAPDGTAVINADDAFAEYWKGLAAPRRYLTFALDNKAFVNAQYQSDPRGSVLRLRTTHGDMDMRLPMLGRHNVMNALAASTAALAAGATLENVRAGLQQAKSVPGRLQVKHGINGAQVIDDSYNANPASLAAGLQVLRDFPGERVLVLGDMGELGPAGPALHQRVGELAKQLRIQRLYAIGELARLAVAAFGKGAKRFDSYEALVDALLDTMHGEMTILVKGSRAMHMERVVAGIVRHENLDALST